MKFKINFLIFFFLLIAWTLKAQNHDRPNVLFIIVDDLNDYVGALNGHKQTKTPKYKGVLICKIACIFITIMTIGIFSKYIDSFSGNNSIGNNAPKINDIIRKRAIFTSPSIGLTLCHPASSKHEKTHQLKPGIPVG